MEEGQKGEEGQEGVAEGTEGGREGEKEGEREGELEGAGREGQRKECQPNSFIRRPVATKDMLCGVHEVHSKALSGCFVIDGSRNANRNFRDVMVQVEESGNNDTPLHLKPVIYHENRLREGYDMLLDWANCKTVIMP